MKILELNQLEKKFGDNKVLKGINLIANKGDVVSIIGSSGSGKSTMLRCAVSYTHLTLPTTPYV